MHTSGEQGGDGTQQGEILALLVRIIDSLESLKRVQAQLVLELGRLHVTAEQGDELMDERARDGFADRCKAFGLTERESQTLAVLLTGATNRKIGRDLGVTERTVKNTLHAVYVKLGVSGRSEAISKTLSHLR